MSAFSQNQTSRLQHERSLVNFKKMKRVSQVHLKTWPDDYIAHSGPYFENAFAGARRPSKSKLNLGNPFVLCGPRILGRR
jgi:hypothetical protein